MKDHDEWEEDLRNIDGGSCRDINLSEYLSREATLALLEVISSEWTLSSATDVLAGLQVSESDISKHVGIGKGALSTLWSGGSFLSHLQCYLCWNPDEGEGVFSELTFFPEKIIGNDLFVHKLMGFIRLLLAATHSADYYVRYENVSWRHGDTSLYSGVIFSHHYEPLSGG